MRISLNPEDFTNEQFEAVRSGGIFNMEVQGIDYEVSCDPNFQNMNFKPIKGVTDGQSQSEETNPSN